jgi:hypothetical protein
MAWKATSGSSEHGGEHADPHLAQRAAPCVAAQEGGDDADDERGLDALAQTDHEGRDHTALLRLAGSEVRLT